MTPSLETAPTTVTKLQTALKLVQQFQVVLAMLVPLTVAVWAGFALPGRLAKVESEVHELRRGQDVLVALACLNAKQPDLATIQLRCEAIVRTVQQAGVARQP